MTDTPHVLMIPSWYPTTEEPIGGIFFFEQAQMLVKAGIKVGVIYPEIRPFRQLSKSLVRDNYFQISYKIEAGMPTYRQHGWNLFPGFLKGTMQIWVSCAQRLFKRYVQEQGRPSLIHAQSAVWGGTAASKISKKTAIPYLIQEHRDLFLHETLFEGIPSGHWTEKKMKTCLDGAAEVVAVSSALKKGMEKYLINPQKAVRILPNFINVESLGEFKRPFNHTPFTFMTLASLMPSKNIDLLLRAFQRFHELQPDSQLLVGGDGPERANLEALCRELQLTSCVHFLGYVPRQQLPSLFHRAHVFVLPSQYETFGIVFIEALAMGLPVIGTACGGPEDIITSPNLGILLSEITEKPLVKAMLDLKANYAHYNPASLREYVLMNFGSSALTQKWLDLYSKVHKSQ